MKKHHKKTEEAKEETKVIKNGMAWERPVEQSVMKKENPESSEKSSEKSSETTSSTKTTSKHDASKGKKVSTSKIVKGV